MKLRTFVLALTVGLLLVGAASCGSSGGSDSSKAGGNKSSTTVDSKGAPDTAAIAKGIQKGFGISASRATCAAKKLQGKLSAKALQAVANAKGSDVPSNEGDKTTKELGSALAACP